MRVSVVIIVVVLTALAYLLIGPRQTGPALRRELSPAVIRMLVETLYHQGFERGMLFVYVEDDPRFVQFVKLIAPNGKAHLRSDFPLVNWSEPYYEQVKALLGAHGLQYQETVDSTSIPIQGGVPARSLVVDFGSDVDAAARYVGAVFIEVYQIDPKIRGVAWLENFSNLPRRIGVD